MERREDGTRAVEAVSFSLDLEELVTTCPNCDRRLEVRRCKLVCPRCHYYMSCAEYV